MKFDEVLSYIGEFGSYQKTRYVFACIAVLFGAFISQSVIFVMDIPPHSTHLWTIMKFDEVLSYIGEFGRFQKANYLLVCITGIFAAFISQSVIFVLDIPPHRCSLGDNDTYNIQNEDHAHLINLSIPWETHQGKPIRSSCNIYKKASNMSQVNNETTKCSSWVFDKSIYESTLTEKFSIVCENRILRSHSNMASFLGQMTGMLFSGYLSDTFGRRLVAVISALFSFVSCACVLFVHNIYIFMVLRGLTNMTSLILGTTLFVLALELTGPSRRVIVGITKELFWSVGMFLLVLIAYFVRDWWTLQLILAAPMVIYLCYLCIIPESPRWLISKNRKGEAVRLIKKMAAFNRVTLDEEVLENIQVQEEVQDGKTGMLLQWVSSFSLMTMSIIICFNWLVCSMVYYGLSLNVQNLSGNIYVNFTIGAVVEMVACAAVLFLLDRIGRKFIHCGCMLIGGISCLGTIFPVLYGTNEHEWITIFLSMIGRFGASGAFVTLYVYTAELYPTLARNTGIGVGSLCARIGGVVSPYIADLGVIVGGDLRVALPLIVFGGFSLAAGLLSLRLPETMGKALPETIEDSKHISRNKQKPVYKEVIAESLNQDETIPMD